jgi:hypothetical protein
MEAAALPRGAAGRGALLVTMVGRCMSNASFVAALVRRHGRRLVEGIANMRQRRYCIKCDCKKLWVIDQVVFAVDFHGADTKVLSVATFVANNGIPRRVGKFEALICANPACGYTEWHAYDLNGLTELAKDPKSGVRLISSEPDSPYR